MLRFYTPENLSLKFKNKQDSLENDRPSNCRKKRNTYPASPRKKGTCRPHQAPRPDAASLTQSYFPQLWPSQSPHGLPISNEPYHLWAFSCVGLQPGTSPFSLSQSKHHKLILTFPHPGSCLRHLQLSDTILSSKWLLHLQSVAHPSPLN